MSETLNYYNPEEIKPFYKDIVPLYQTAFAGEPWYEVTKCADEAEVQRCIGGFSALPAGTSCEMCGNCLRLPAYETPELIQKFEAIAAVRETAWYLEGDEKGTTLAAFAWKATPSTIADERYADRPEMKTWLESNLGPEEIIWLDEVFADTIKRPSGNLKNFRSMCEGLSQQLENKILAYRTINPRMTTVVGRDFAENGIVLQREIDIPDRRDLIVINFK